MCGVRIGQFFCLLLFLMLFCERCQGAALELQGVCTYEKSQMLYQMIGQDGGVPLNSPVDSILEFLDDHIDELKFAKSPDLVFVMGTEDSDKTTLISFITDAELEAIEVEPCNFTIVDKYGQLNQYPLFIDSDVIPQLFTDKQRGVEYYVFPDFNVGTDVKRDLTAAHLMYRTLQFATGIKFVFTLSYSTIKKETKDAILDIADLVRTANTLITDFEEYTRAISLVVTKVEYEPATMYNGNIEFEEMDKKVIEKIGHLLRSTRDALNIKLQNSTDLEESDALDQDITFIEVLAKEYRGYKKIKILRLPIETGSLNDMAIFQYEKIEIMSMIRKDTKYIPDVKKDFFFKISNETRDRLQELIEETETRILADFSIIEEALKEAFVRIEKEHFDLDVLLYKMNMAYKEISRLTSVHPQSLVANIIESAEKLKIKISVSSIDDILKHIEVCNFLKYLQGPKRPNLFKISEGLSAIIKYLKGSVIWYEFLSYLDNTLSEYNVQKNVTVKEYEEATARLMLMCEIQVDDEKNVIDIGLKEFFQVIGSNLESKVEHLTVNSFKLKKLGKLLHSTMNDYGTKFCSPGKLMVQGYNVKISDVIKMECPGDITFWEIFVMNNLFIDADFKETGIDLQLIIIAPTWEIIGNRTITLNGENGEIYTEIPTNGNQQNKRGSNGKPGGSGYSAGCFMAIGDEFINDAHLAVNLTGGRGGDGQNGGKGYFGNYGKDPTLPERSYIAKSEWDRLGFTYEVLVQDKEFNLGIYKYKEYQYKVSGSKAVTSGGGGDGGVQGIGGLKGKTFFVGIKRKPNFAVFNKKGGVGGPDVRDGKIFTVEFVDEFIIFGMAFGDGEIKKNELGQWHAKGPDGQDNQHKEGIEKPYPAEFIHPSHSINSYKSYLRENLAENFRETKINKFMIDIEANEHIRSKYHTMGYFNELESLENQYLQSQNKISFIPFYESLKERINEYATVIKESDDHRKILMFLHTTVMGKILSIKNFHSHISIVDLSEYLEIVHQNIHKLGEVDKIISIAEETEEYQKQLMDKIKSANEAITNQIIPAMMLKFEPLGREIINLLEIVIQNRDKAKQDEEKLLASMSQSLFFDGLKTMGAILQCFGPTAQIIGIAIELGATTMEETVKFAQAMAKMNAGLEAITTPLKDLLKGPFHLYYDQLIFMYEILTTKEYRSKVIIDIITQYKIELQEHINADVYVDVSVVFKMRSDLDDKLKLEGKSAAIDKVKKVNKIAKVSTEVWKALTGNDAMLNEYYKHLEDAASKYNKWDARVDAIQEKLLPMMYEVQKTMINVAASIANNTGFELDITAWKVQTTMGDFKLLARQMSSDTGFEDGIVRIIEQIEEAFGAMINIFDRIQSYMEQSQFAAFLSALQSPNNQNIDNIVLRRALTQLKQIVQSNLVMEQYVGAIHSFKQHFFPFAAMHLATFNLPMGLNCVDVVIIVQRASAEIDYLKDQVKFLEITLGRFDSEIFGHIDFNSNNFSAAVPFFIFKSREYKREFKKLLNGEEIIITADITRGLSQNAIKFNEIGVQLKLIDDEMQGELDVQLEYFGVRMTLMSHAYYKCGEDFYYVSVDDTVVIEFSFKKDSSGKPIRYNDIYRKLSEGHYFLSPYGTWKIELVPIFEDFAIKTQSSSRDDFKKLFKFRKSAVNLELVGQGQYFKSKGTLEAEVCTSEMRKYYKLDRSTSDIWDSRHLRQKYLF